MRNRIWQRWLLALGMVAMLGTLIVAPVASAHALPGAEKSDSAVTAIGDMPCHKPAKPCPDCPQKSCPEMANCFIKCFQLLASPDRVSASSVPEAQQASAPFNMAVPSGSLVTPLLRPPIL